MKLEIKGRNLTKLAYFLPETKKYHKDIFYYFESMILKKIDIKIICRSSVFDIYNSYIKHSGIIISDKELNKWGLPIESTARQIQSLDIDALIDLSPYLDLVHAHLIRVSRVPVRIGFKTKRAKDIFNIILYNENKKYIDQYNYINQILGIA